MSKIKIAELFYSVQGEGRFMGVPSVFLRTFGCNFTCGGFGMSPGALSIEADAVAVNHTITPFAKYEDLRFEVSNGRTLCRPCHKKLDPHFFNVGVTI